MEWSCPHFASVQEKGAHVSGHGGQIASVLRGRARREEAKTVAQGSVRRLVPLLAAHEPPRLALDAEGNDRNVGGLRDGERSFLEGAQAVLRRARSLGEDEDG